MGLGEVETLRKDFDFTIDWRPYFLRPDAPEEGWELPERIRQSIKDPNNPLTARAAKLGITIKHRLRVPNSRKAHEATEYARSKGKLAEFHHAVLERYWSQGEDISDWEVLKGAATAAGLDGAEMQAEVEAGNWKQDVLAGVEAAHEIGINAVPTIIVGGQFAIQGAQDAR
ncbi:MAG TPA: DsbA family oxidoreductase, partial [Archangium sp.]